MQRIGREPLGDTVPQLLSTRRPWTKTIGGPVAELAVGDRPLRECDGGCSSAQPRAQERRPRAGAEGDRRRAARAGRGWRRARPRLPSRSVILSIVCSATARPPASLARMVELDEDDLVDRPRSARPRTRPCPGSRRSSSNSGRANSSRNARLPTVSGSCGWISRISSSRTRSKWSQKLSASVGARQPAANSSTHSAAVRAAVPFRVAVFTTAPAGRAPPASRRRCAWRSACRRRR